MKIRRSTTITTALPLQRESLSALNTILCLGLVTLFMAACSGPVSDNELPEDKDGLTSTVTMPQPGNTVATGASIDELRTGDLASVEPEVIPEAIPEARVEQVLIDSNRAEPSRERVKRQATDASAVVNSPALVVSQSSSYIHGEADRMLPYHGPQTNRENYLAIEENAIKRVADNPVSTFSIDVDTASYSNIRRMITREGRLPPADAVRLEEMINYFDYNYETPDRLDRPLAIHTEIMAAPWNQNKQLMMVGMKGFEPDAAERPAANLVFLVDVSGSMQSPDKLGLVKSSLQLLASQMRAEDRIALVVYAGAAGIVLDSTSGNEKSKIIGALDSLAAGGSTNGAAGIELAYRIAQENKIDEGINRVIIASDGDLNVGVTSIDALKELVADKRENGIALTTLGYGTGNYNYSLMEQLADTGNGNAAYIDSLSEAQKVLVEEMQSTLLTIAKDVKIQIEFNPDVVAEYRLIGYENRILNREDFRNDKIDAGEVGAGHTVTALYEISLKGSEGTMIPDLRYGARNDTVTNLGDELAYVNVRFKMPEASRSTEFGQAVLRQQLDNEEASENIRFAAAVAGFGQLLRGGRHTNDWSYDELLQLARQSRGDDEHGYRSELVKLVELARVL